MDSNKENYLYFVDKFFKRVLFESKIRFNNKLRIERIRIIDRPDINKNAFNLWFDISNDLMINNKSLITSYSLFKHYLDNEISFSISVHLKEPRINLDICNIKENGLKLWSRGLN